MFKIYIQKKPRKKLKLTKFNKKIKNKIKAVKNLPRQW